MDPDVRHIVLGFNMAMCVVSLAWIIDWRHYSRYFALVFPGSSRTTQKRAIRFFFVLCLVGGLLGVIDSLANSSPSMSDLGWSSLYGAIVAMVFFAMDVILRWLRPNGS